MVGGCATLKQKAEYTRQCFFRRKHQKAVLEDASDLSKCLTTFDLTNLGIGSILGAGIYVVSGQVSLNISGPSVILSFTIAAFASLLSGLCYAEFGSRVPNTTGSAYAYSYHTVGEFIAFVIGWNLILEYMIGTAADARALSSSIDYLAGNRIQNFSIQTFGIIPHLNTYPDFLAFILTIVVTIILAVGVKESARYTVIFNILNGGIALLVIILGSLKAKSELWTPASNFFPRGAHGVFAGAAACFYAFVGFDIIATTGEEARSPSRSIPTAIALSLLICYALYIGVSTVITMMLPFGSMQSSSPLTEAFDRTGLHWAKWVVGCGAMFGLCAALLGSEFPLPRIIYAMAIDGLLFKFFRHVSDRTETPVLATLVPGFVTAFFSMLFDLRELVEMMSIGTLLAYSLVCTSVLLLRYRPNEKYQRLLQLESTASLTRQRQVSNSIPLQMIEPDSSDKSDEDEVFSSETQTEQVNNHKSESRNGHSIGSTSAFHQIEELTRQLPTARTHRLVTGLTVAVWVLSAALSLVLTLAEHQIERHNIPLIILAVLLIVSIVICVLVVCFQPQDCVTLRELHFKVPLVPIVPLLAVFINVFLMIRLSTVTWIRFGVWMTIGLLVYIFYGMKHSEESVQHLGTFSDDDDDGEPVREPLLPKSSSESSTKTENGGATANTSLLEDE